MKEFKLNLSEFNLNIDWKSEFQQDIVYLRTYLLSSYDLENVTWKFCNKFICENSKSETFENIVMYTWNTDLIQGKASTVKEITGENIIPWRSEDSWSTHY